MKKKQFYKSILSSFLIIITIASCKKDDTANTASANGKAGLISEQKPISSKTIPVSGRPYAMKTEYFNSYDFPDGNYGQKVPIILYINADNSIDVAWRDYTNTTTPVTHLSSLSASLNIIKADILPQAISQTESFVGFTKSDANTFFVAYSKTNSFGDKNNELWLSKLDNAGIEKWSKRYFGNKNNVEVESRGNVCQSGSGCLAYDPINKHVVMYLAHQKRWDDNIRHQASFIHFVSEGNGDSIKLSNWFYSHNFNQKIVFDPKTSQIFTLAHGDTYPRQLGFATWNAGVNKIDKSYFTIDGNKGDNNTNASTGDIAILASGNVAAIHTSSQGRAARDIRIAFIDPSTGLVSKEAWLTNNIATQHAFNAKVAKYGKNALVAWNVYDKPNGLKTFTTYFAVIAEDGTFVYNPEIASTAIELLPEGTLHNLSNGDVIWAVGSGNNLVLHTFKLLE